MKKLSILICFAILFMLSFFNTTIAITSNDPNVTVLKKIESGINVIFVNGETVLVGTKDGLYIGDINFKNLLPKNTGLSELDITAIDYVDGFYYIGTNGGGLYRGLISDAKWTSLKNQVDCPTISSITHEGSNIYVSSFCSGFYASFDNGTKFFNLTKGLISTKATAFCKGSDGYYLGTDEGLYYSKTIQEDMQWTKVLNNISVTTLKSFGNEILAGTSTGLVKGSGKNFTRVNLISGSPYIKAIDTAAGRVAIGIDKIGLALSCDGIKYNVFFTDILFDISTITFDVPSKRLLIGTSSGTIYSLDLTNPFLLFDRTINGETEKKGNVLNISFPVYEFSFNNNDIKISAPSFMTVSKTSLDNKFTFSIRVDTSKLTPQKYSIPITLTKGSVQDKVFLNFEVIEAKTVIKLQIGSYDAFVNGVLYKLDAVPFIDRASGRTLVPIRFVSEALNFNVSYNSSTKEISIVDSLKTHKILLYANKKTAYVDGKPVQLDVAPVIIPPGRTFVPIRFVTETFNGSVNWDAATRTIEISF